MSEKSMTGEALESALGAGTLDEGGGSGGPRSFEALVRTSDKEGHVGVAVAGCGSFVDVPTELIAAAEKIGYVACGGHGHPQMRITLKSSDDPVAQVLVKLFQQARRLPGGAPDMGPVAPGAPDMGAQARFNSPMVWYGGCLWVCICVRWSTQFPGMCNECRWTPMFCPGGGLFAQ